MGVIIVTLVVSDADLDARAILDAPGHTRGVVCNAKPAIGTEEDDATVAAEAGVEVLDGSRSCLLRGCSALYAINGPLAENELHDGLAPAGEGGGGGLVIGVAAAADQGRIAHAAGRLGERSTGAGAGGEVAVAVDGQRADGVVRVEGWVFDAEVVGKGMGDLRLELGPVER